MASKDKKKGKLQKAVLLRTIIPMIMMGIIIAVFSYYSYKGSVKKEIEHSLSAVAASVAGTYDLIYPGDYYMVGEKIISIYKGNTDITGNYEIIDRIKRETGMDVTVFYQNTRILTTLQDNYGGRYIQTGVNAGLYSAVSSSTDAICYQVNIDKEMYYACYLPLYNQDETFVGIVATAIKQKELDAEARQAAIPIILITMASVLVASLFSYSYTNKVADSISKICKFLKGMIGGKLDNELAKDVLHREDEIGITGKSLVDMQNAIRVLVERDPLTQLYNRRYGGAKLRNVQKHANKCGMPYAVCICDIDFFKKVNDTYGHDAGDVVLKKVAEIMRKSMAGKGFVARWGGEEFLLIFDKVGIKGATKELNKILDTIRATEIPYDELIIKITMSFGVVDGDQSDDYGALLRHADARLYYGKLNGRNQVVSTDHHEEETEDTSNNNEVKSNPKNDNSEEKNTEEKVETANTSSENTISETSNIDAENEEKEEKDEKEELISKVLDYSGDKESEFLVELLRKMNEQLFLKTVEENNDDNGDNDKD